MENIENAEEFSEKFDFSLWKKLWKYMKQYSGLIWALCIYMVLNAFSDAIFPLATKYAIDNFIVNGDFSKIVPFVCFYLTVIVVQSLVIYLFITAAGKLEAGIVYSIRKDAFKKLQKLSFSYYDTTAVGWIMARMTSDAQRIGDVIAWGIVDLLWAVAIIIIVIFAMFSLNIKLALIVLSVIPILVLISFYFQKKIFENQRKVRKVNSKITASFNEGITGARTTKTLTREDANYKEFNILTTDMRNSSVRSAIFSSVFLPIVLSLGSISVGLALYVGGIDVFKGAITFGTMSVFISYGMQIFEPIQQIARVFSELQSAQASAERTFSLVETEPDIKDTKEVIDKCGDYENPKPENWCEIKGNISFENVNFSYKTGEKVLKDFNLEVKAGEKIALVGETGSGKSTIVNLICRFYEPTKGVIKIDGKNYKDLSQICLHSNLGYVLQTPHLFSGTIMDNIKYAKENTTDDEAIYAAKMVGADNFIKNTEKGYDTEIGEGGSKLSAGERQLISFARAIVGNPAIFILDEATSSIDTETEQIIQKAINTILAKRTSFIVAHRLSTIRFCDRILVINEGEIVESGTHKELLKLKGEYFNFYTNQFKEDSEKNLGFLGTALT